MQDAIRCWALALMVLTAKTANNVGTIGVGLWAEAIAAANTLLLLGAIPVGAIPVGAIPLGATALIGLFCKPLRDFQSSCWESLVRGNGTRESR